MFSRITHKSAILFFVAAALYVIFVLHNLSLAYLDFGDGNYAYISARMAQGVPLYTDIISPQPPLHLNIGAALLWAFPAPLPGLWALRLYTAFTHLLTALGIALCSMRLFGRPREAALAFALTLFLPVGLWWTLGFQSEATLLPLLVFAFYFLLTGGKRGLSLSAICCLLGLFTNMTALPFVILHGIAVYLLYPKLRRYFFAPLGAGLLAGLLYFQFTTQGAFWVNVWGNQVGTYPPNILDYSLAKLLDNGLTIVHVEGGILLLCLAGIFAATRTTVDGDTPLLAMPIAMRRYVLWVGALHLGSILFITKGGTVNYIFCLAEPIVALFAARALVMIFALWKRIIRDLHPLGMVGRGLIHVCLVSMLIVPPARLLASLWVMNWKSGTSSTVDLLHRVNPSESGKAKVIRALAWIEQYSAPGDMILTPPYYAFAANRPLPGECSSTFMLGIRYFNTLEEFDGQKNYKSMKQAHQSSSNALIKKKTLPILNHTMIISKALSTKNVKVVLWRERRHPFYLIPEIKKALEQNYYPVPGHTIQNANEKLLLYLPKE
jgi:hypothetical protein